MCIYIYINYIICESYLYQLRNFMAWHARDADFMLSWSWKDIFFLGQYYGMCFVFKQPLTRASPHVILFEETGPNWETWKEMVGNMHVTCCQKMSCGWYRYINMTPPKSASHILMLVICIPRVLADRGAEWPPCGCWLVEVGCAAGFWTSEVLPRTWIGQKHAAAYAVVRKLQSKSVQMMTEGWMSVTSTNLDILIYFVWNISDQNSGPVIGNHVQINQPQPGSSTNNGPRQTKTVPGKLTYSDGHVLRTSIFSKISKPPLRTSKLPYLEHQKCF